MILRLTEDASEVVGEKEDGVTEVQKARLNQFLKANTMVTRRKWNKTLSQHYKEQKSQQNDKTR